MRRLMAAAVLAAVCATAACSDSGDSPGGSALGGSSSSAGAGAPSGGTTSGKADEATGSGNTKQVCADAEKVMTDTTLRFGQKLTEALEAAANGDAGADAAAVKAFKALFNEWADGIREQAGKATDGQLKAALTEVADQIAKVAGNITSMDNLDQAYKLLDAPAVDAANAKLESLCG